MACDLILSLDRQNMRDIAELLDMLRFKLRKE